MLEMIAARISDLTACGGGWWGVEGGAWMWEVGWGAEKGRKGRKEDGSVGCVVA